MNDLPIRVRLWDTAWGDDYRLCIIKDTQLEDGSHEIRIATGFEWGEPSDEGAALVRDDGIGRAGELVQKIVDEAWEKGFRPTGFTDVKNETAAIRDHLKDMRTVAFHKLGIPKD